MEKWRPVLQSICALLAVSVPCLAGAAVIYVSPDGADANDGLSATSPLLSPIAAIEGAHAGDEIRFASGTYLFERAATNKVHNLTLTGTAARDVIFDGGGATRILTVSKHVTNTAIYGITFRNARETCDGNYGNMEAHGGAVRLVPTGYSQNTMSRIENCAFVDCESEQGGGGGLYVGGGSVVSDTMFTGCRSGMAVTPNGSSNDPGGALYVSAGAGDVEIVRCTFVGNVASNGVGAVGAGSWDTAGRTNDYGLAIRDCGFTNNVSYGYAGCIGIKAREVSGCSFAGNVSRNCSSDKARNGGAVWSAEATVAAGFEVRPNRFTRCTFLCNTNEATNGGGVFLSNGATLVDAEGCTFAGNASVNCGNVYSCGYVGAAQSAFGGLSMTDCVVSGNVSIAVGTVDEYNRFATVSHMASGGTFSLSGCRFIGNADVGSAGAVFAATSCAKVENCEFIGNTSTRCGFAASALAFEPYATNVTVRGCLFAGNVTDGENAGVAVRFGPWNPNNLSAYCGGTNCVIESCTFVDNVAQRSHRASNAIRAGAVNVGENGGSAVIRNCVFSGNEVTIDKVQMVRSFSTIASCAGLSTHCYEDGTQLTDGVNGNIVGASPRFASAASGRYAPRNSSPFVDRGAFMPWMEGATDLAGNRRVVGAAVDMGCYECQGYGSFTISVK